MKTERERPRLLVTFGDKQGIAYGLSRSQVIGRASSCDIQLLDAQVSRRHCRVFRERKRFFIEDLQSANGTWVNESRTKQRRQLVADDQIQVGHATLVFAPSYDVCRESHSGRTVFFVPRQPTAHLHQLVRPSLGILGEAQWEALTDLLSIMGGAPSAKVLLDSFFARLQPITNADHIYFIKRRLSDERYLPVAGVSREPTISISRAIIDEVFSSQTPLEVSDTMQDLRFQGRRSVMKQRIRSVICLPIQRDGEVFGVIYVDRNEPGAFSADVKQLLRAAVVLLQPMLIQLLRRGEVAASGASADQGLVGVSRALADVRSLIDKISAADSAVLITGETGTGKELAAALVHQRSKRQRGPFVAINCGSIPAHLIESELFGHEQGAFSGAFSRKIGLLESAEGGTVFLDEIAELEPGLQVKLLRALQERHVIRVGGVHPVSLDTRVIAATNRDLQQQMAAGRFREDLYYRLNVLPIHLPPLRERREDIVPLLDHYLTFFCRQLGCVTKRLEEDVLRCLVRYSWPGNVRELKNLVERLCLLVDAEVVSLSDIPVEFVSIEPADEGLFDRVQQLERSHIGAILHQTGGNKSEAARRLKISRPTLDKKIRDLGITTTP